MNYELFQLINNLAGIYTWLDISMILTVKYLAGCFAALLFLLLGLGIYYKDKTLLKTSIHTIVFLGIILITHSIIGFIIQEPRPFVTHTVHLLISHAADSSFPSTHAMAMTAIALPIFATYKRLLHHPKYNIFRILANIKQCVRLIKKSQAPLRDQFNIKG